MKKPGKLRTITPKQRTESGMAFTLILLIVGFLTKNPHWFVWAIPMLLLTMIYPMVLHPFAILWYALSDLMGSIISRVILAILFFVLVTPMGIIRRLSGKDSLKLRSFKKSHHSVMVRRDHAYSSSDLENPF